MTESHESSELDNLLQQYLDTLTEKEKLSYEIAVQQLGSSFQLDKSSGFVRWVASLQSK